MILAFLAWWGDGPIAASAIPEGDLDAAPSVATAPKVVRGRPTPAPDPAGRRRAEAPREIAVDSSEDLLRVLAEAPPRSTIVLADEGPYDLRGAEVGGALAGLDLTIRAEAGVRPVLRLARDPSAAGGSAPAALLDLPGGRLTLDGLEFLVEAGEAASRRSGPRTPS